GEDEAEVARHRCQPQQPEAARPRVARQRATAVEARAQPQQGGEGEKHPPCSVQRQHGAVQHRIELHAHPLRAAQPQQQRGQCCPWRPAFDAAAPAGHAPGQHHQQWQGRDQHQAESVDCALHQRASSTLADAIITDRVADLAS
ncbi:hypothetical protein RZS08_38115, partial [Arthrospira platensis SPKY1]|nr:hypothetical protein [Arthrospira platensis SPKY1]